MKISMQKLYPVSIDRQMVRKKWYIYMTEHYMASKKEETVPFETMDGPREYYAKRNKSE